MILFQAAPQKDMLQPFKGLAAPGTDSMPMDFVWKDGDGFAFSNSLDGTFKDD